MFFYESNNMKMTIFNVFERVTGNHCVLFIVDDFGNSYYKSKTKKSEKYIKEAKDSSI